MKTKSKSTKAYIFCFRYCKLHQSSIAFREPLMYSKKDVFKIQFIDIVMSWFYILRKGMIIISHTKWELAKHQRRLLNKIQFSRPVKTIWWRCEIVHTYIYLLTSREIKQFAQVFKWWHDLCDVCLFDTRRFKNYMIDVIFNIFKTTQFSKDCRIYVCLARLIPLGFKGLRDLLKVCLLWYHSVLNKFIYS